MLLRQPATALKLDVECFVCELSCELEFPAGATFGDLVDFLEQDVECECEHWLDSDDDC